METEKVNIMNFICFKDKVQSYFATYRVKIFQVAVLGKWQQSPSQKTEAAFVFQFWNQEREVSSTHFLSATGVGGFSAY